MSLIQSDAQNRLGSPPISRLPTEIIQAIFIHCATAYYYRDIDDISPYVTSMRVPWWINVSYVCRRWRQLALDCPRLWTCLFLTSPRWVEELLYRSKQAPLKLSLHLKYTSMTVTQALDLLKQVTGHAHVEELELAGLDRGDEFTLFPQLCSRAPLLQRLTISTRIRRSEWSSVLFDGDTPSLRTLHLTNCPVPWYSFHLGSLTTLILGSIPVRFRQSMEEFMSTLRCMQGLTYIHLQDALSSAVAFLSGVAFRSFQKFNLPHLCSLLIVAPTSAVIAVMSCIDFPFKAHVLFLCQAERGIFDDYALLSPIVCRRITAFEKHAFSGPSIRSLAVAFGDNKKSQAVLFASVSDHAPMSFRSDIDPQIPIRLHLQISSNLQTLHNALSGIFSSISLTTVQSIHISEPPYSSTFWRDALEHFPSLRYLKLSCGYMPDLAPALAVAESQAGQANTVLGPALLELELKNISLSAAPQTDHTTDPPAAVEQDLYDALRTRTKNRIRLTMTDCTIIKNDLCLPVCLLFAEWVDDRFDVALRIPEEEIAEQVAQSLAAAPARVQESTDDDDDDY